jgi:hypothetical protein
MSNCCGSEWPDPTRFVSMNIDSFDKTPLVRTVKAFNQNIVEYKAMSRRSGISRRRGDYAGVSVTPIETKSAIKKAGRALASIAIPGDLDPLKSPIRSSIYRALTPGLGGGGRGGSRSDRGYRCPEGYQYGGRFTDSRLSTCGAKLFDIPSALGAAIGQIKPEGRRRRPMTEVTGEVIRGGRSPESPIESRKPQVAIPKVSAENKKLRDQNVSQTIQGISSQKNDVSRMVRRDGFILEPVVPSSVLRTIPDNRNMEGATYLLSSFTPKEIGRDELGLLSNTGVSSVIYVLPNGSYLTIEKARELTVGERRKLGKTVRTATDMSQGRDPASRLKFVANEMGDGIRYSEEFGSMKNPNEIISGRPRWATEAFKARSASGTRFSPSSARPSSSLAGESKKINSVEYAIDYLANGGKLSEISPKIIAKILADKGIYERQVIDRNQSVLTIGSGKYVEYKPKVKFQHLAEKFASDLQEHMGLDSPDIIMVDKPGEKRKYLREDVETALPGSSFNPSAKLADLNPEDVARMMISDFLTDQRERQLSSVYAMTTEKGEVPMLAQNFSSGLTDLDKIEISTRTKMSIAEFYGTDSQVDYSDYYGKLKIEQQLAYRRMIDALIRRAKSFKIKDLRRKLSIGGLSPGEIAHLEIIEKIYGVRLGMLNSNKKELIDFLKGE